jgi:hypothetical protein
VTAAVASVAPATANARNAVVFTPSARASSSPSVRRFNRQRSSSSTTKPSSAAGAAARMSSRVAAESVPSSQKVIAGSWLYGSARIFRRLIAAPISAPSAMPARISTSTGSP